MPTFSNEIFDETQKVSIVDFAENHVDEILQIQTETDLSAWSRIDYLNEINRNDSLFKAAQTANEKIIAFALVRLLIGNSNASDITFDSSEILNIAVRQSFQHKGIGQIIFDEILRELKRKSISQIWLEVRQSNANAINFYQKNEFERQFERKNYYSNPIENALVFRRLISE